MKKFYTLFFIIIISILGIGNAKAQRASVIMDGPAYYNECFLEIEANLLIDTTPLLETQAEYTAAIVMISTQLALSTQQLASSIESAMGDLAAQQKIMADKNYDKDFEIRTEVEAIKNDNTARITNIKEYVNTTKFPVNPISKAQWPEIKKDTPEWDYFKNVCEQDKLINVGLGVNSQKKLSLGANIESSMALRKQLSVTNTQSLINEQQNMIVEKYCNEDDARIRLCKEASPAPNANLIAANFISPSGIQEKNENSPFKTFYTYSKTEEAIASDFLSTILMPFNVDPPKLNDILSSNEKSKKFLALYNTNLANLNLAHYSFVNAKQNRKPSVEIQIPDSEGEGEKTMTISYFDSLRYMIHQAGNSDTMAALNSAGGTAAAEHNYKINILRSKLQVELYMQSQRMAVLDAAILSMMQNSGKNLQYLESIK